MKQGCLTVSTRVVLLPLLAPLRACGVMLIAGPLRQALVFGSERSKHTVIASA